MQTQIELAKTIIKTTLPKAVFGYDAVTDPEPSRYDPNSFNDLIYSGTGTTLLFRPPTTSTSTDIDRTIGAAAQRSGLVSGAGGISDGNKGDIVISGTGTVWTVNTGVITTAKLGGDITTVGKALLDDATVAAQRTTLGLGTAAVVDVPSSGNATSGQAVTGADTRLSDSRPPTTHTHSGLYPVGGSANQVLTKLTGADYNVTWTTPALVPGTGDFFVAPSGGDDTSIVAAACASAITAGTRVVLQTGALYLLNTWSTLVNTGLLRIVGNQATLQGPSARVIFAAPDAAVDFYEVKFTRWTSAILRNWTGAGSMHDSRLEKLTITDCTSFAIYIACPASRMAIARNDISTCAMGIYIGDNGNTGTEGYDRQDSWVSNTYYLNKIHDITGTATFPSLGILAYGKNNSCMFNEIYNLTSQGANEAWGIYVKWRDSAVFENRIDNIVSNSTTDNTGISIKGSVRTLTTSGSQGFNVTCSGNRISNIGVSNSRGSGIKAQNAEMHIFDNVIKDAGLYGIVCDNGYLSEKIFILRNEIEFTTATGTTGIFWNSLGGDSQRIISNKIKNAAVGINFYPLADISKVIMTHNEIDSTGIGISLRFDAAKCTDMCLTNSQIRAAATGAIYHTQGNNTTTGLVNGRIADNYVARSSAGLAGDAYVAAVLTRNND